MRCNFLSIVLLSVCLPAFGQNFSTDTLTTRYALHSAYFSPEKLYLHVDRTAYCAGETIWFNGYLKNASSERQEKESNYIYVELTAPDGNVERRCKVRREGGSFPGHIFLPEDIAGGKYILKAYSLSQLDLPQEYFFHQEITIIGYDAEKKKASRKSDHAKVDVSFYPEGGRCFVGMPCRMGVKVMDSNGRSLDMKGVVVDEEGSVFSRFETSHDGMGLIQFIPGEGHQYFLVAEDGSRYPLPELSEEGAAISATPLSGRTLLRVFGKTHGHYSLLLRDISSMRLVAEFDLDDKPQSFMISDGDLAAGINHLILIDGKGRIVSERLLFEYGADMPTAHVSAEVSGPGIRETATLKLDLSTADGAPLDGLCSVAVVGASLASYRQDDGIDSYMLLTSELKGALNDPRWYFDPEVSVKERSRAMDLLMMIQGWSYYDLPAIADPKTALDGRKHAREFMQSIRGKVQRAITSKVPTNFMMTILFPSLDKSRTVSVSQGKRFILDSLSFEEGNGVMIKISRESGRLDYIPSWEGDEFAPEFRYARASGHAWRDTAAVPLEFATADTLNAAVVSAEASSNILGINGRTLPKEDYKMYGAQTLIQYLAIKAPNFRFDGTKMHNMRTQMLDAYGEHDGSDDIWDESPVQLVVDGSVEPWEGFSYITISEIESIAISAEPDPIYNAKEGVVAINLQYGARASHLSDSEPSLIYFIPLGYQSPQKFYAPRYDLGLSSSEPDRRNTLFWDPQVRISEGKAELVFCTDDREDYPYLISVEGLSSDGKPFSATCRK